MPAALSVNEQAQLQQTIEMFEVITQSQPLDCQSLEILKEAYFKLGRQKDVVNTSKRIAQAYMQLGQLSSAILEYESVLQLFPDDPDVRNALAAIEQRANSLAGGLPAPEPEFVEKPRVEPVLASGAAAVSGQAAATEIDDGRKAMQKILVDGRFISETDFNKYWVTPDLTRAPTGVVEPFLQVLADKGVVPLDKSLKIVCEKSRLSFLPLDKYEVDIELIRSFSRDVCRRWCVLPFDRMSKAVLVATANPFNKQATRDLEGSTRHRLLWYLASPSELVKSLQKAFR
jgi:tetratricopeptide (TPR) repeat protein